MNFVKFKLFILFIIFSSCNESLIKQKDKTIDSLISENSKLQSDVGQTIMSYNNLRESYDNLKAENNAAQATLNEQAATKYAYVIINFTRSYPSTAGGEVVEFNYCTPIRTIEEYTNDKKYQLKDNELRFFKNELTFLKEIEYMIFDTIR